MKKCILSIVAVSLMGCGHVQTSKVGLMSFGNLEGKTLPENLSVKLFSGKACGHNYRLSDAVRDALKGTEYDTLINAEVINETGFLVSSNCFIVSGHALNSSSIVVSGVAK